MIYLFGLFYCFRALSIGPHVFDMVMADRIMKQSEWLSNKVSNTMPIICI